jgi:hypothetical protein
MASPSPSTVRVAAATAATLRVVMGCIIRLDDWRRLWDAGRLLALLGCAFAAAAQDPFEIHIYEYEPLAIREYSLEAHLNFDARDHQTHLTMEPTFGISPEFAVGFMFLNAWQPGNTPDFAGWRVLPHFYAPESWGLPLRVGFVAEFSFQSTRYEENSRRVELRPILDREFDRWQIVFNPVFERALHGPGVRDGWNFEPAVLVRWKRKGFSPSLEYYLSQPATHQIFAGGDWEVRRGFTVNLGLGFDLTGRGPGVVLKSRFEWDWKR